MRKNTQTALFILLIFVGILSIAALGLISSHKKRLEYTRASQIKINGTILEHSKKLPEFHLTSTKGGEFNNASLKKHWTMMFFGFSNCGYVCPTTLAQLNMMNHQLQKQLTANKIPQVVMVSVDPARDTKARLKEYVEGFNPDFIAARTDQKHLRLFTEKMGISYQKVSNSKDPQKYMVTHTATIMLINPEGNLEAIFSYPHEEKELEKDYLALVKNS